MPKFPDVHVELVGKDGNAFAILARVRSAVYTDLKEQGFTSDEIDKIWKDYLQEAQSSDYDHLLCTTLDWFCCDDLEEDEEDWDDDYSDFEEDEEDYL